MGIAGYNAECRKIVQRYVAQWRHTITRLGRWVDFDNDYKTMDTWYMESVWWVVKQLWEKGLIYQGVKVMPISTELGTVLSNFEATQNYQDVQDPAITVLFKLVDEDAYLAIWTTTPWTLPSNLAICVGADIRYAKVRDRTRECRLLHRGSAARRISQEPRPRGAADVRGSRTRGPFIRTVVPVLRRPTRCRGVRRAE